MLNQEERTLDQFVGISGAQSRELRGLQNLIIPREKNNTAASIPQEQKTRWVYLKALLSDPEISSYLRGNLQAQLDPYSDPSESITLTPTSGQLNELGLEILFAQVIGLTKAHDITAVYCGVNEFPTPQGVASVKSHPDLWSKRTFAPPRTKNYFKSRGSAHLDLISKVLSQPRFPLGFWVE